MKGSKNGALPIFSKIQLENNCFTIFSIIVNCHLKQNKKKYD